MICSILINSGTPAAWRYIKNLNLSICPYENETDDCLWGHPETPLLRTTPEAIDKLNQLLIGYEHFEKNLNYQFNDVSFLLQAVTHPTFTENDLTNCYKPLDFIGDAAIDYIIARHLYRNPKNLNSNELTDIHTHLVNNTSFATIAVRNQFHQYIRLISKKHSDFINSFVRLAQKHNYIMANDVSAYNL